MRQWLMWLLSLVGIGGNRAYAAVVSPGAIARLKQLDTPCGCNHVLSHRDRFATFLENTGAAVIRLLGVFHPSGSPAARYDD